MLMAISILILPFIHLVLIQVLILSVTLIKLSPHLLDLSVAVATPHLDCFLTF